MDLELNFKNFWIVWPKQFVKIVCCLGGETVKPLQLFRQLSLAHNNPDSSGCLWQSPSSSLNGLVLLGEFYQENMFSK